jgi:hypothetical protein
VTAHTIELQDRLNITGKVDFGLLRVRSDTRDHRTKEKDWRKIFHWLAY